MLPRPASAKLPRPARPAAAEPSQGERPPRVLASSRAPAQLLLFSRVPPRRPS